MKSEKDISLILSGVRALIGEVTPCLRSASVEWNGNKVIFKCVFDETATEKDLELISVAAGEIIADFSYCDLENVVQKISPPEPTNPLKNVLYHRYESNYW
ncbi:MAG: hypothetical protein ACO1G9_10825 [Bacteroidota bacterium]